MNEASEHGDAAHHLLRRDDVPSLRYSICTLVTRPDEYEAMLGSFRDRGFGSVDCEYLWVDNSSGNGLDAYAGCNRFLSEARGEFVILCHQDILLIEDREALDAALTALGARDPHWGLAGNAGAAADGSLHIHITDPSGPDRRMGGPLPARVVSLDENFIVARRAANLALSRDLEGFHLYGTDLCVLAETLGWSSYVIDFHLRHKSGGNLDRSYHELHYRLQRKYQAAFRGRWVPNVMMHPAYLSSSATVRRVARAGLMLHQMIRKTKP